jgi:D-psicose/D-tagatose/L-ribulose 3-epimerase
MNNIGIHYGSFVQNWMDEQLPLIAKVKELGFDLLELGSDYLLSLNDTGLANLKAVAADQEIELAISLGLTPAQDIASPEAAARKAGIDILKRNGTAMAKAGISDCSGILYCAWNGQISGSEEKPVRWEHSVSSMREVVKVYEDQEVHINVEVANRFENYLINNCREGLAYLEEVESENIGLHLDTFHMNIEEDSFIGPILAAGSRLRYFHIGENNRKMPGLGMMPWRMIFDALKAVNYVRPITMEPFVKPGGEIGAAVSLYRPIMDTSCYENDLRQSLAFVRSMLA